MKLLKTILKLIFGALVAAELLAFYALVGERSLLTTKVQTLNFSDSPQQSIKIVQFTDAHLGEYYTLDQLKKAVEQINDQNPDMVIFTGDLFDISSQFDQKDQVSAALEQINAPLGKFCIFGNRDYGAGGVKTYQALMEKAGFTVLVDEKATVEKNGRRISLYGCDDALLGNPDPAKLMQNIDQQDFNILISHEPDTVDNYTQYPIDLALSGHSHGGQVILPFYGPIVKTNLCDTYFKGLYQLDNPRRTQLYVSSGLGNTKAPIRFGNVPEIVSFEIHF